MPNVANPTSGSSLSTMNIGAVIVRDLLDSVRDTLAADGAGKLLTIFQYAPSVGGWGLIEEAILNWMKADKDRVVEAFVGTDDGLTDPAALEQMDAAGVQVHLLVEYSGVYHPKVFLLRPSERATLWVGSNNMTVAGMTKNVELAFKATGGALLGELALWEKSIRKASKPMTSALLRSYRGERDRHEKKHASKGTKRFVWSERAKPKKVKVPKALIAPSGALVLQIMPKETGVGGKQIQPPIAAVSAFFGLSGQSKVITARMLGSPKSRQLTLTKMANHTARLTVSELDYSDRPCYMIFTKLGPSAFEYEIVSQSVQPARYLALEKLAVNQGRSGSRRWAIT